jgi:hypothetical protein
VVGGAHVFALKVFVAETAMPRARRVVNFKRSADTGWFPSAFSFGKTPL